MGSWGSGAVDKEGVSPSSFCIVSSLYDKRRRRDSLVKWKNVEKKQELEAGANKTEKTTIACLNSEKYAWPCVGGRSPSVG